MPPAVIQHIEERLRSGKRGLPVVGLRLATNPNGISQTYLKNRFVRPTDRGQVIAIDEFGREAAYIPAKVTDNPYIDKGYEAVLDAIADPQRRKAMRDGDWDANFGMFFEQWDRGKLVVPPFNSENPYELPATWQRYCGIDYGWRAPYAAIWAACDNDGRLWVYREICASFVDARDQARLILEAEEKSGDRNVVRVADPSMWGNRGTPLTIADIYGMEGCGIAQADNDRLNGWARVHHYLNNGPPCEYHRELGWEACPLMHIFDGNCPQFVEDMPALPRSQTRPDDAETRNVADHLPDACLIPGTLVLTLTGSIPIERIQTGQKVMTRQGWRSVTASGQTGTAHLVQTVSTADGARLTGTKGHPVWTENRGWISLGDLIHGDKLLSVDALTEVTSNEMVGRSDVYNLAVDSDEEYFANGLLVHNCRYMCMAVGTSARPIFYDDLKVSPEGVEQLRKEAEQAFNPHQTTVADLYHSPDLAMKF
jgi:hypothetical protein